MILMGGPAGRHASSALAPLPAGHVTVVNDGGQPPSLDGRHRTLHDQSRDIAVGLVEFFGKGRP